VKPTHDYRLTEASPVIFFSQISGRACGVPHFAVNPLQVRSTISESSRRDDYYPSTILLLAFRGFSASRRVHSRTNEPGSSFGLACLMGARAVSEAAPGNGQMHRTGFPSAEMSRYSRMGSTPSGVQWREGLAYSDPGASILETGQAQAYSLSCGKKSFAEFGDSDSQPRSESMQARQSGSMTETRQHLHT
jgi:hypothetical protein